MDAAEEVLEVDTLNMKGKKDLLAEKIEKRCAEIAEMRRQRQEEETRRYEAERLEEQPPS